VKSRILRGRRALREILDPLLREPEDRAAMAATRQTDQQPEFSPRMLMRSNTFSESSQ